MSEVPSYSPGLEGVIAGESAICQVDPEAGLIYRGYDVEELAKQADFEQVVYLLIHGQWPTKNEAQSMRQTLAEQAALPGNVVAMLRLLPPATPPIDAVRTGVSMLSAFDPDANDASHDADMRKSIRIVAQISTLITSTWRLRNQNELVASTPGLTHAERFFYCLNGLMPKPEQARMLDVVFILYAEHEFNASTFAARVTASTLADVHAAVVSALATLKGPLHGGANQEAMVMLREIGKPEQAEAWVDRKLAAKQKIMGFGHRVYRRGDSRVPAMRQMARELVEYAGEKNLVEVCEALEKVMENRKKLYANLDLYAAPVLHFLGFPAELNVPIFAAARAAGWCAHVIEQHAHNRLIRPRSLYTGPARRPLPS